jgi:hypothetical protein
MRKTILAVTTAAAAVTAAAALGLTGAATASTTKTEHLSFMDTSKTSQVHSVIATGAFTDDGTILLSHSAATMRLSHGTIKVTPQFTQAPQTKVDKATCLVTEHSSGTYTLSHGTGRYKGITGSGKFTQSASQVGPTLHKECSFTSGNPVASQQTLVARGPVSRP